MSTLGKYLLIFAAVGALVAFVFGWLVIGQYNDAKTNLAQATSAKDTAVQNAVKLKQAAADAQAAQAAAEKQVADDKSKLDDLNTQVADATKKAADAQGQLDAANAAKDKATSDLATLTASLQGHTAADLIAAADQAKKDLQAAQDEQKIMQDNLQADEKKVAELMDAINRSKTGDQPPGISGKVTWVNRTWNFVVLDVGLSNGVVPNGELIVYRKNSFLGKVRVTSVDANSSVADILPDVKGDIQVGDYVLN
jgi:hypothetical protein